MFKQHIFILVMKLVDICAQIFAQPFEMVFATIHIFMKLSGAHIFAHKYLLHYLKRYLLCTIHILMAAATQIFAHIYLLNFWNFDEADGWCSGGDGGGCLQGCDATGEHFVNCISSNWTTVFLGSKRMHFFGLNKRICLSGILFILWIFKFCLSGFFLFCEFYPVNCIFFVFSTAMSFVLSTAVSLSCQLHSLCIVNCIFFCIVSCISFVLSIAFPLCFQLHFLFYCQLHFLCVVNFIYWSQSTEFSLFCHPYIFAFLLYLSIIIFWFFPFQWTYYYESNIPSYSLLLIYKN